MCMTGQVNARSGKEKTSDGTKERLRERANQSIRQDTEIRTNCAQLSAH